MRAFGLIIVTVLSACATSGPPGSDVNDPYEPVNRGVHSFNKSVDKVLYRPVSTAYGFVIPRPLRQGVNNFSQNLGGPQDAVNSLIQGRVEDTVHTLFRFVLNTTLGVAGVFDPATSIGLERRDTDFGETLHVWGVGEGAYLSVPFFGPSTQRDTLGDVVDLFTDPFAPFVGFPEAYIPTAAWVLENADDRYQFSDTIDSVLYDSTDSYAQSRLIYLDNRRFELGGTTEDVYFDPYEELLNE